MFDDSSNTNTCADILIIDDTLLNLQLLSSMLSVRGYTVRQAVNTQQALKVIDKVTPDLILLDIMMPEMTGYEFCKQLKESKNTKDIPVIFISALDDVFDKVLAFDVGGADYITKPFRVQEVIARIENQLTLHRQDRILELQNSQPQHVVSNVKLGEEDLLTHLNSTVQNLHITTNRVLATLKDLRKHTQREVINRNNHKHYVGKQQDALAYQSKSKNEISISVQAIDQMIKDCDDQTNLIDDISRLIDSKNIHNL